MREQLADLCHDQWAHWMKHLFSKCTNTDEGDTVIPAELSHRWTQEMMTAYGDLWQSEQENHRAEADEFMPLIERAFKAGLQLGYGDEFAIGNMEEHWERFKAL